MKVCAEPGCPNLQAESRCLTHRRDREQARGTRAQRGYGPAHRRLRAKYQRRMDAGERFTCWRPGCGKPIDPKAWHLGHDDEDRKTYRGPECVPCNTATASRKPVDRQRQVVLVCGPPCSGKSTYVRQRAERGDLIVDYDDIAQRLGSPRTHGHDYRYHRRVESVIARALAALEQGKHDRAWVIRSLPVEADRTALARRIRAEVVVIDAPDDVLLARARQRRDASKTVAAIAEWRRQAGEVRLTFIS